MPKHVDSSTKDKMQAREEAPQEVERVPKHVDSSTKDKMQAREEAPQKGERVPKYVDSSTKDKMEAREEAPQEGERVPKDVDLHMGAHAQQETQVHAHGPDIGPGLAGDPEHHQLALLVVLQQLAVIDGAHAQLALDRRDQWRPLK